jgi:hypothetical protein
MINACDMNKKRELVFASEPSDQVLQAHILLSGLSDCEVLRSDKPYTLVVHYSLEHYTLEGLERALSEQGFVLDNSFLHRVSRQVIYYCEDTELHNIDVPDHPTKKREKEIFIHAYDQHLHGDYDETTPPELRRYK